MKRLRETRQNTLWVCGKHPETLARESVGLTATFDVNLAIIVMVFLANFLAGLLLATFLILAIAAVVICVTNLEKRRGKLL